MDRNSCYSLLVEHFHKLSFLRYECSNTRRFANDLQTGLLYTNENAINCDMDKSHQRLLPRCVKDKNMQ
jgi:hypothetical protein